jgi:hypothetical protein
MQDHGGQRQLVANFSKVLDPVSKGGPEYIPINGSHSPLNRGKQEINIWRSLIVSIPHQARAIINQNVGRWLTVGS